MDLHLRIVSFVSILYTYCLSSGGHWHLRSFISASYLCVCLVLAVFSNSPVCVSSLPALFMFPLSCWPWFECAGAGADWFAAHRGSQGLECLIWSTWNYQANFTDLFSFSFSSEVFCSLYIRETEVIQDILQGLKCHSMELFLLPKIFILTWRTWGCS